MTATGVFGLTYADLLEMPSDDGVRRELIDGQLYVNASPDVSHQAVVGRLYLLLNGFAERTGGLCLVSPMDVLFEPGNVLEPDVILFAREHLGRIGDANVGAPTLAVEVSSYSTRRYDLVQKRRVYERFGVDEYWFVDRDERELVIHERNGPRFDVRTVTPGQPLASRVVTETEVDLDALLAHPLHGLDVPSGDAEQ